MDSLDWLIKLIPNGGAFGALLGVLSLFLLKYIPSLLKQSQDMVQGIVDRHSATLKEEREMFRGELKELRTTFSAGLKDVTEAFARRDEVLTGRVDSLTEAHRDLRDEFREVRAKLEK